MSFLKDEILDLLEKIQCRCRFFVSKFLFLSLQFFQFNILCKIKPETRNSRTVTNVTNYH